ncbi:MAG TPA: cysteine--tRNA ligase [Streptosporangiaceae bacterium]
MDTARQLRLYNSLGRRLEDFQPAAPVAGLYSCGPTVYAFPHLGNMRPYVFADTLRRALRWKQIPVRHVINITDVGHAVADTDTGEDKLEVAAARERRSVADIAAFYTGAFFADVAALNILPADEYPRATAYVGQMIEFAARLEAGGYTYRLPSGLYFDTSKSPGYGTLAQIDVEGQREAARVEQVEGRRRKTDFALWRAEPPGQRRVMRWDSPWGPGAPGWHLECSVMSIELLGPHFDIHTGGVDHRELHHVNEIAQSEACLGDGRPWVRYWLHNEFLGKQKMSKSEGGAPRLADLTEAGYHPLAFRLFLLGSHYRSQLDFSTTAMDAAQAALRRLVRRTAPLRPLPDASTFTAALALAGDDAAAARLLDGIDEAITADLATPRILALVQDALRDPVLSEDGRRAVIAASSELLGLGLGTLPAGDLDGHRADAELDAGERQTIEKLIAERAAARQQRDWARADEIRAELDRRSVVVTDTPEGPVWELR